MDLKSCPECSELTAADNDACPYCGHSFGAAAEPGSPATRSSQRSTRKKELRNQLIAAICAFLFLGWGQWYNGRTAAGIYIIAASAGVVIVSAMLMYVVRGSSTILTAIAAITGIIILVIWVYSIATAYNTARGINRGGTAFTGKSLLFWMPATLWVMLVGVIVITVASSYIPGLPGATVVPTLARTGSLIQMQLLGL